MSGIFSDLKGTTSLKFRIGLLGVLLKSVGGHLFVRNTADSADAQLTASQVNITGPSVVLDSAANPLIMSRNAAQAGPLQFILPALKGTVGQVLAVKAGTAANVIECEYVSAANTSLCQKTDTTAVAFNSASPVAMMTTGEFDVISLIEIDVITAFDDPAANLSVGITGAVSKYVSASGDALLTEVGLYQIHPNKQAQGVENLIATLAPGISTVGAVRINVIYSQPA